MKKFFVLILLGLLAAGCNKFSPTQPNPPEPATSTPATAPAAATSTPPQTKAQLTEPISGGLSRVTKKFFGTYVTPQNSPVQPERFTGYHTGIDFETYGTEKDSDVAIFAACDGKLLLKKYAGGYGGVAVQSCTLDGNAVTLIYGHLRLSSITPAVGSRLTAGQQIAVLGTGYSTETDGERKHLHFAIHKGTSINILGYVQNKADLSGWLNPENYLK